ncbi:MAG: 2-hydroxyacid dehydrogenase [Nitrosopumilaceae archaeon]
MTKIDKEKVFLTRTLPEPSIKELKKNYHVEIHKGPFPISKKKLIEKIKNKDGLICYPYDKIDREVIIAGSKLKTISTFSVGYDHIDIKFAKKRKISIGYTPNILTIATADLTIALMLDLLRRVTEGDRLIRSGKWTSVFGAVTYVGEEVAGKTLGILGLGRIGLAVAKRAQSFGIKVIYHNRTRLEPKKEKSLKVRYVTQNDLFKKSDIISLHIPYSKQTHELVKLPLIKKMKKCAYLINTSRGKIIKEKDLVFALKRKIISGAALDVFLNEPISNTHPFTKMQNVVLTPHIGSSSIITRTKMAELTVKNLRLGLEGKKLIYSV